MPTLTSLLSRDAVVTLDAIEQALQRQVLEGGELDTALLELSRVPENVLASYRAASFGLPAAEREDLEKIDAAVLARVPREIACAQRIVPIAIEGDTLVIASAWPLREPELNQLAARLGCSIALVIATEVRIQAALAAEHGLELGGRMRLLAERLAGENPGQLCKVHDAFPSAAPPPARATGPGPTAAPQLAVDEPEEEAAPAARDSRPPPAPVRVLTMVTLGGANGRETRKQADSEDALETRPSRPSRMPAPRGGLLRAPRRGSKVPRGPLTQRQAAELLTKARDRDAVLEAFFAFARQYFDCSVLFAVRDERLLGVEASGLPQSADLHMVDVAIGRAGNVQGAIRTRAARVVQLGQNREDAPLMAAIGRAAAQPCALLPIVVRERVVSLLYGDRGGEALVLTELADLLATLPAVSSAFERIIQARKLEAMRAAQSAGASSAPKPGSERTPKGGSEPAPQGTFSRPPPAPNATIRGVPSPVKAKGSPDATAGKSAPNDSTDAAERPTLQLPMDEIERGARLRAMPSPPLQVPTLVPRQRREQDITRPARPSRLSSPRSTASGVGPPARGAVPPAPNGDEPVDPPPPRTLSQPPPGVGSYAVRDAKRDVIDLQEPPPSKGGRAQPAKAGAASPPAARAQGRVDPRRESGNKPSPEVVSLPPGARDLRSPKASAEHPIPDQTAEAERLVTQLAGLGPDEEPTLMAALLRLGPAALGALERRFPGSLWFERNKLRTHVPSGHDVSAIARALFAFDKAALPHIARLLAASKPEVRLCAVLVAQDCVGAELLAPIGERLFDADGQVRLLALEALPRFRNVAGFDELRRSLRTAASQETEAVQRRLSSLEALSVLRDEGSVAVLADLGAHQNKQLSVPAHRTLIAITGQDFGVAPRKWKNWYDRNRRRHRAEWLIDGLMHSEERVRATAGAELQRLTQVYFGFVASAGKRDRERAQTRYRDWWENEGRAQFE